MRKIRNQIWKISKWIGLIAVFCFLFTYIWIRGIYKESISDLKFENHIVEIASYPELPKNLYSTFEKVYPKIFKQSMLGHFFSEELLGKNRSPCPCRWLTYENNLGFTLNSRIKSTLLVPSLILAYESELTQKQCFNAVMANYDFFNSKGIEEASQTYYSKKLEELVLEEQLELIVMMRNVSLFNKYRRPELVAKEVDKLKLKFK